MCWNNKKQFCFCVCIVGATKQIRYKNLSLNRATVTLDIVIYFHILQKHEKNIWA